MSNPVKTFKFNVNCLQRIKYSTIRYRFKRNSHAIFFWSFFQAEQSFMTFEGAQLQGAAKIAERLAVCMHTSFFLMNSLIEY